MRFRARIQVACFALLGFLVLASFGPLWIGMLMQQKGRTDSSQNYQRPQVALNFMERNSISAFNVDVIKRERRQLRVRPDDPHDKWIVVSSPKSSASDISSLTQIPGWKVLVAGDAVSHTAEYCRSPNCTFLSLEKQFETGFSILHKLPESPPVRKNIAYLYAIANGAKFILDFDVESTGTLDTVEAFILTERMTGLMYSSSEIVFNSYRHFGQPTFWPRGFPLEHTDVTTSYTYKLHSDWKTPVVQQGIINNGPDLDAFVLLTRKLNTETISLDQFGPPSILPEGTFTPVNSKNTLFHKEAFWGLLLSTTTSARTSDIWRGYWLQRLLWEIEGYAGVFPPNANAVHRDLDYLKAIEEERSMYNSIGKLLNFLLEWKCPPDLTFFQCMLLLGSDMVINQFWEKEDVELTSLWLEALVVVGYPEPKRGKQVSNEKRSVIHSEEFDVQTKRSKTLSYGSLVTFGIPPVITPLVKSAVSPEIINSGKYATAFANVCQQRSTLSVPTPAFAEVVGRSFNEFILVVVVTEGVNIQYIDAALRLIFLNVIYCGDDRAGIPLRSKLVPRTEFIFIELQKTANEPVKSLCAIKAMELNFNESGILVIGSDTLLNLKQLRVLNPYRIWVDEAVFFNPEIAEETINEETINAFPAKPDSTLDDTLKLSVVKERVIESKSLSASLMDAKAVTLQLKDVGEVFFIPRHLTKDALYYFQTLVNQGEPLVNASSAAIYTVLLCNDYEIIRGNEFLKEESISLESQMNFKAFLYHVDVTDGLRDSQLCDNHFFLW